MKWDEPRFGSGEIVDSMPEASGIKSVDWQRTAYADGLSWEGNLPEKATDRLVDTPLTFYVTHLHQRAVGVRALYI